MAASVLASKYQGVKFRAAGDPVLFLSNPPGIDGELAEAFNDVVEMNDRMSREFSRLGEAVELSMAAAAVKQTYDKIVAKNPLFGITLFPPPNTKPDPRACSARWTATWTAR